MLVIPSNIGLLHTSLIAYQFQHLVHRLKYERQSQHEHPLGATVLTDVPPEIRPTLIESLHRDEKAHVVPEFCMKALEWH